MLSDFIRSQTIASYINFNTSVLLRQSGLVPAIFEVIRCHFNIK